MRKIVSRYTKDDYIFVYQMLSLRSQGTSYPKIGKMFNKDHSTIIHWCKKFNIDIGTPMYEYEEFLCLINNKPLLNKFKYKNIVDETINKGKNYSEYLEEARKREGKHSIYFHVTKL